MPTPRRRDLTESLVDAAINDDVEKVKSLIKQRADVNGYGFIDGLW